MADPVVRGRKNIKPRKQGAQLTWLQCVDDEHSFALRQDCKYRQANAVRDSQLYSDATLIERAGDDLIIETPGFWNAIGWQAPKRWAIDLDGNKRLLKV